MKKHILKNIYKYDEESMNYIIEISLDFYQELFNDWDASPIRRKDLDPELITFIESSGHEIPLRKNIELNFSLPKSKRNIVQEKKAIEGVRNYFKSVLFFVLKDLKYNIRKIILFIILGLSFIFIASFVQNQENIVFAFDVLIEGIYIGGWVLIWEAFSLFFFKTYTIRKRKNMYLRFLRSPIRFVYKEE